jgi:hypothetical protein
MITTAFDRDEWFIDESIKETFPASDSTSPARPGSLLGIRNSTRARSAELLRRRAMVPSMIGALLGGLILGFILTRPRNT